MRLLGFEITRAKAIGPLQTVTSSTGGWWPITQEPYTGAWQANAETSAETVLTYSALYACVSLIASDIGKMRVRLIEDQNNDGIWTETTSPSFSPVLRKPNHFQNRLAFFQWWLTSKLLHGNTYALKQRDNRGLVTKLYLIDPTRVRVLVAPDGSVFYELPNDTLAGLYERTVTVPAREIIHDVNVPLFHPLVGVTPIYACGMSAWQGLKIQGTSSKFFAAGSQPGGVLTAPGTIAQTTADRLKAQWETNFSGDNVGKVAVLGDGLKYEPMTVKAVDSQLIEQLRWTGEDVCSAFHVPPYMVGVGPEPTYANAEIRFQQYYSQCLQTHIEALELCLDEGLELPTYYGIEFNLDDLLRMDSATKMTTAQAGVAGGILTPNEARKKFDLGPKPGGDTPYLQQQLYSLAALDQRDTAPPTPAPTEGPPAGPPTKKPDDTGQDDADEADEAAAKQLAASLSTMTELVKTLGEREARTPEPPTLDVAALEARITNAIVTRVGALIDAQPDPEPPAVDFDALETRLQERLQRTVETNAAKAGVTEPTPIVVTVPVTVNVPSSPERRVKSVSRDAHGLITRIVEE